MAIRYQTYDDEDDEAVADALDGGAGTWTRLQLIEMDLAFCAAMRRAHPELELHDHGGRRPNTNTEQHCAPRCW